MSKKFVLLVLFISIALLVAACGGAAPDQAQQAVEEAQETATEVQDQAEEVVEETQKVVEEAVAEATEEVAAVETEEAMAEAMAPECEGLTPVSLQLQWVTQSQFAGFFAARDQGFYEEFCLDVTILEGAVDIVPQQVVAAGQAEFGVAWVPKVLASREAGADLVNIAQIFQRSGTLEVSWVDNPVPTIADMAGKKVGTWGFGNEHELFVALRGEGLDPDNPADVEVVQQSFDMLALLNRELDAAQAMTYNEYAQVLEAENPDTGALYQPEDLVVIDFNDVGTAMLQDHVFVDGAWLAEEGNEQLAVQFLAATFKGWEFCRDNFTDCVNVVLDNGPTLGEGHMTWQLNEVNKLIWPSPAGIGVMDQDLWDQTVQVSLDGSVITEEPTDAFRTDLAEHALALLGDGDHTGSGYSPVTVQVVPGGGAMDEAMVEEAAGPELAPAGLAEVDGLLVQSAGSCDYGGKIAQITALDELTVEFTMCGPDPAFLAKAAFTPFGIQPREYIESTGGTGAILEQPIGTGPYMLESWNRGDSLVYKRFDDYWGDPAIEETLVVRWASEGAARLLELQSGTVDQITNVSPDDFETVRNDDTLQLLPVANPNTLYLGMTNTFAPFDDVKVRQAIAMGIDRQRIVDNFYPDGSEVASHFTPCSIPNGCAGEDWYEFDPEAAKALLAEAGFPDGFESSIYYRDVFRGYLPEPGLVAVEFQTQLKENLNIDVEVVVMESGEFIDKSTSGELDGFHLLGWGADYPHVTNFLDFHFSGSNPQFGDPHPAIFETLEAAAQIGDIDEAAPLYEEANNAIKELVPMVPIAHGASAQAARANITTNAPPFGAVRAEFVETGTGTFVWMQNAEPIGLWCADQTDGESLSVCQFAVEPLLNYAVDSGDVLPALATSCEPNADSTVWTCFLREGVKFHDGSTLDANDVVASWAAGIDAANPNHVGTTGSFDYYSYLWDGLINAE